MATVVVVPEGGTMAEQYQREYDGGGRGRGDRGDSGRYASHESRMHPHDVNEGGRYEGDGQSYGGSRMSGRDTRQEYESRGRGGETPGRSSEWGGRGDVSSRGTEWSAGGRGGYGSESRDYEPNRWRDDYSPQGSGRYDTQSSQSWRSQADGWRGGSGTGGYGGESGRGYRDDSGGMSGYGGSQYGGGYGGSQYGGGYQDGQGAYGRGNYGQGGGYQQSGSQQSGYGQSEGRYGAESWRGYGDESRGGTFGRNWNDMGGRQGGRQSGGWQGSGQSDWQQRSGSMGSGSMSSGSMGSTFAGRGPKDYQRSDERIREEVSDRMTDDHDLDASEISVEVRGGEVTLTGTVRTRDQKRRAEDLAEQCSGVGDVTNNIRVKQDDSRGGQSSGKSGSSQSDSSQSMSGSGNTGSTASSSGTGGQHGQSSSTKAGRQSSSSGT